MSEEYAYFSLKFVYSWFTFQNMTFQLILSKFKGFQETLRVLNLQQVLYA